MSGHSLARQPNAIHARERRRASLRPLVSGSLSINGEKFSALVPDGASPKERMETIARHHGGGVATIYNEELKAFEIVAVKVGDHLLVKGDPDKVAKADFSHFKDQDSVKESAVRASHESKGGIHYFLGENGIPMAVGDEGGLVFPNAEELRLRGNGNTIHISLVDYNANPVTLNDLDGMYSKTGGVRMSELAQRQMAQPFSLDKGERFTMDEIKQAHGGMRSEKLLLVDTSVLILNKDSGDIMTMAENGIRPEGFMAPHLDIAPLAPVINQPVQNRQAFVEINRLQHADLGPMLIPMDGSALKIPYLFIKVFDGNVEDAVSVTHPLEELKTPKERKHQEIQLPAVMLKNKTRGKEKKKGKDIIHTEPEFTLRPVKTVRTRQEKFWMPLTERFPQKTATPRQVPSPSIAKPKAILKSPARKPVKKSLPLKKAAKKKKKAKRLKPQPSAKKKKAKKIHEAGLIKKKRKPPKITEPLAEKAKGTKKDQRKRPKPRAVKAKRPSALNHEKTRKRKAAELGKAKAASKNKKRKRMKSYFLKEMLGLYRRRTRAGRTRARSSR